MKPLLTTLLTLGAAVATVLAARTAAGAPGAPPAPASAAAADPARGLEFFEARIRPLLVERCAACHTGAAARGKLDLRSPEGIRRGGELGPAVVPGDPGRSLLIQAVRHQGSLKMPPTGRLTAAQVADLTEWVRMGAPLPATRAAAGAVLPGNGGARADTRKHWAFQPLCEPPLPAVRLVGWARNPIDRFILARLEAAGLRPSPWADRRTLIRRASFDLTGLPPTPEEVDAFEADREPRAYERLVERLLASTAYGERWGRHWLDVVRYSDSNGADWNEVYPNAWRYRDYVIRSFNTDKPFDQFIREQIAGDLMPGRTEEETYERIVATGMLVMGPKLLAQQDRIQLAMDVVDEQIDVTSKAFFGLTLSCARCHDHKFDPISTREYYGLAGIFKSTVTLDGTLPRNNRVMYWHERPLAPPNHFSARQVHEAAVKKMQDAIKKCKVEEEKTRLTAELKSLESAAPPVVPTAMAVSEGKPGDIRVHVRGSHEHLGEMAPRRFPAVLGGDRYPPVGPSASGRLELAGWITSPQNPLTPRVIANRLWHWHFGQGLVPTPDNFGLQGERPSHPELLDYLSGRLAHEGWSLKNLHRLIMLSATYQQSSAHRPPAYARDPDNRLVWRMNRRRLESEAIRDAMLAASGRLDRTPGGTLLVKASGFPVREFPVNFEQPRRSVYLPVIRGNVYPVLRGFDFADPSVVNGRRSVTTVATQALLMLNSPFVMSEAEQLAGSMLALPAADERERVEAAYRRTLGRRPDSLEANRALRYLEEYAAAPEQSSRDAAQVHRDAWRSFCQVLFASSEFRYLD